MADNETKTYTSELTVAFNDYESMKFREALVIALVTGRPLPQNTNVAAWVVSLADEIITEMKK